MIGTRKHINMKQESTHSTQLFNTTAITKLVFLIRIVKSQRSQYYQNRLGCVQVGVLCYNCRYMLNSVAGQTWVIIKVRITFNTLSEEKILLNCEDLLYRQVPVIIHSLLQSWKMQRQTIRTTEGAAQNIGLHK